LFFLSKRLKPEDRAVSVYVGMVIIRILVPTSVLIFSSLFLVEFLNSLLVVSMTAALLCDKIISLVLFNRTFMIFYPKIDVIEKLYPFNGK